jgi:hypothetical protein
MPTSEAPEKILKLKKKNKFWWCEAANGNACWFIQNPGAILGGPMGSSNHPICGPRQGKPLIGRNDMNFAPSHSPAMATISPPT